MVSLILNKKAGFINLTPEQPVIIRDFRGKLFYSTEGLRPVKSFNLPQGTYLIDRGNIKQVGFIKPKLYPIPEPERRLKAPFDFKIEFANNPNKCTIQWTKKRIVFDYELKEKSLPELFFILYHEYSHALYKTEKYADLFAANLMLKKGYNPSQIGKAPLTSLSNQQFERKHFLIRNILRRKKLKL